MNVVTFWYITPRSPEYGKIHNYRCENFKSYMLIHFWTWSAHYSLHDSHNIQEKFHYCLTVNTLHILEWLPNQSNCIDAEYYNRTYNETWH
jgi:hypothetical protein